MRKLTLLPLVTIIVALSAPAGAQTTVMTKHCVGNPPRQTEDPMSPPCVAYYAGDNGGATSQGVTRDEITVLVYFDGGNTFYDNEQTPPAGTYIDTDIVQPNCPQTYPASNPNAARCDSVPVRVARALGGWFNDRYETYGRRVHVWAYSSNAASDPDRRIDAQDNFSKLHPFAVLDEAIFNGHDQAYIDAMAARGVMTFSAIGPRTGASFQANTPLDWSFWPDVEHAAANYAGFVCSSIAGRPVRHSGLPGGLFGSNGRPRRYGMFSAADPAHPEYAMFAAAVIQRLADCGISIDVHATFVHEGYSVDGSDTTADALAAAAKFKLAHVTTILWPGGIEGHFSQAADQLKYYPEIIIAGDRHLDTFSHAQLQNQNVWRNVWGTSSMLRLDREADGSGYRADRDTAPTDPASDGIYANDSYRDFFTLFYGIQVAGPNLTPAHVDQGLHAIPPTTSSNPYVAAFWFDPGDHTGVKDAMEVWWDPTGAIAGTTSLGCYRMVQGGSRYRPGSWSGSDFAFALAKDPCQADGSTTTLKA